MEQQTNTAAWAEQVRDEVERATSFSAIGTSDHETSLRGNELRPPPSHERYLWFGRKRLEAILAEKLIKQDASILEMRGYDAKLANMISDLSYGEFLQILRERDDLWCLGHALQTASAKDLFLFLVGKAFAGGPQAMQKCIRGLVITELEAFPSQEKGDDDEEAFSSISAESEVSSESGESRSSTPPTPDMMGDVMPRYTMALHEHCKRQFMSRPTYTHRWLTLDPPAFIVTVSVAGEEYQGNEQPKKKWAEHAASWEACRSLNIEPM